MGPGHHPSSDCGLLHHHDTDELQPGRGTANTGPRGTISHLHPPLAGCVEEISRIGSVSYLLLLFQEGEVEEQRKEEEEDEEERAHQDEERCRI
ncbi:hypothetical protein EYF80_007526 [Liparis tanakae]|uniref:Uncharacterized protein n=1 Tax=Liparis tanakae TaxID=230148 RepID=A0A4Z2IXC8_9TELE|nr:hypothetical protein EYF80_007526 [Liparis tanakae]